MFKRPPRPYWNPYMAGLGLGLVLLLTFVTMGHGLGASGAVATLTAAGVDAVAAEHAQANPYFSVYLEGIGGSPLKSWIVVEVIGVLIGSLLSALLAGRVRRRIDRGPRIAPTGRLYCAFGGGSVMAFGAALAGGCTSGLALSGGALLSVGGWIFMLALFAAGYAVAPLLRRVWT